MRVITLRAPAKRRRRTNPKWKGVRYGRHRPTLEYTKKGWRRPKNPKTGKPMSRFFKKPTRINAKRRRRARVMHIVRYNPKRRRVYRAARKVYRRRTRRNPVMSRRRVRRYARRNPKLLKGMLNRTVIMTGLKVGGGIIAGYLALPLVYKVLPATMKTPENRRWLGAVNVALGMVMFSFIKRKMVKDMGLVIAATGIYDLIAVNVPQLGLPKIPESNILINQLPGGESAGASYGVPRLPVSQAAALSASYQLPQYSKSSMGASYMAPNQKTAGFGCDNPFDAIEGYQPPAY